MSRYISGFCGNGHCEGTRPKTASGKPRKVCVAYDVCECKCHVSLNEMHELAGKPRRPYQNPAYEPPPNVDLTWLDQVVVTSIDAAPIDGMAPTREPVERPSAEAPGLRESTREWHDTPSGARQRGQLEEEVRRVCNQAMRGTFGDSLMTPPFIAHQINEIKPPSTGAIGRVLDRWEEMGFAKIHRKPVYFEGYTLEGLKKGLEQMKAEQKRKAHR